MSIESGLGGDQSFDLIKWVNETDEKNITASHLNDARKPSRFESGSEVLYKPKRIEELLDYVRTEAARNKEQISPETAAKLQKLCHSIANSKFAKSSFFGQIKGFFEDRKIARQVEHATRELDLYALQNPGIDLEAYAKNLQVVLQNASRSEKREFIQHVLGPECFLSKCQELPEATDAMKGAFRALAKLAYREGELGVSLPASKMAPWAQKELKQALREEMLATLKPKIKLKLAVNQLTNPIPSLKIPPQPGITSLVRSCVAEAAAETLADVVGRPQGNLYPEDEQAITSLINAVRQYVRLRLELAGDKPVKVLVRQPKETNDTYLKEVVGIQKMTTTYIRDFSLKMLTICEHIAEAREQFAIKKAKEEVAALEAKKEKTVTPEPHIDMQEIAQKQDRRSSQFYVLPDAKKHFPELFVSESVSQEVLDGVVNRMRKDSVLREFLIDDYKAALREGRILPEEILPEILLDIAQSETNPNTTLTQLLKEIVAANNQAKLAEYKTFINEQFKKLLGYL